MVAISSNDVRNHDASTNDMNLLITANALTQSLGQEIQGTSWWAGWGVMLASPALFVPALSLSVQYRPGVSRSQTLEL
jgi:hypothetical protein